MRGQVFYHDTDAGGVVYYANYLKYMEAGRTDVFQQWGTDLKHWHEQGVMFAVSECQLKYRYPLRYGDKFECQTQLKSRTSVRLQFDQRIIIPETEKVCVTGVISVVCLNKDFKPMRIPTEIHVAGINQ